jgi:tyrosyl-tRNA synthetase
MNLFEELKWRGFIKDVSNEELANEFLNNSKIAFYCGFDPTASSLTIGHLVQIIRILLLQKYGHKPIVLIGGGTGLIGDPRGTSERKLLTIEESLKNAESFKMQFSKYISFDGENGAIMVNNYDWLSKINMIEFLRDYGKNFNINYMLSKETVASRLETGISYTEFSYMIIQSIDFLHLYEKYNCKLQFGGSDQWGNITAGLDLIRKKLGDNEKVLGMTSPLLTKSDGTKISKSEGGAIWLDKDKTSSYELYQFFLNTTDADVINYLKTLTLLEKNIIDELEQSLKLEPEKRVAQKTLAYEIVKFVHGIEDAETAKNSSEEIFSNNGMSENMPTIELSLEDNMPVVDLLLSSNLVSSKSEARRLIEQGGITINQEHITNVDEVINIKNEVIIQKGKKTYLKVKVK